MVCTYCQQSEATEHYKQQHGAVTVESHLCLSCKNDLAAQFMLVEQRSTICPTCGQSIPDVIAPEPCGNQETAP